MSAPGGRAHRAAGRDHPGDQRRHWRERRDSRGPRDGGERGAETCVIVGAPDRVAAAKARVLELLAAKAAGIGGAAGVVPAAGYPLPARGYPFGEGAYPGEGAYQTPPFPPYAHVPLSRLGAVQAHHYPGYHPGMVAAIHTTGEFAPPPAPPGAAPPPEISRGEGVPPPPPPG